MYYFASANFTYASCATTTPFKPEHSKDPRTNPLQGTLLLLIIWLKQFCDIFMIN